jgi:hypothetical protein
LKAVLKKDAAFTRCLTVKLATYALGRGMTKADDAAMEEIVRSLRGSGAPHSPTLQELIEAIVASDLFRTRALSKGS